MYLYPVPEFKKFPYRSEFPDPDERARSHQTLEDALGWARWQLYRVWRVDTEYGKQGEYTHDAKTAIITNRNTSYRWILRRGDHRVDFQTPAMFEEEVGQETIDVHFSLEEAESLARVANGSPEANKPTKALAAQALDQIGMLCRQVRERVRLGDEFINPWTRSTPRRSGPAPEPETAGPKKDTPLPAKSRYRPLGDPDNLSLKEAGEIVGKGEEHRLRLVPPGQIPARAGRESLHALHRQARHRSSALPPQGVASGRAHA